MISPNLPTSDGGAELWHGGAIAARSDHRQSSPIHRFDGYTRGGGHGKLGVGIVTSISATQNPTHGARRSPELRRAIPGVAEVNSARDAAERLPLGPVIVTDTTRDADGDSAEDSPAAAPFFSPLSHSPAQ